jgi:hypothetical protein
VCDPGECWTRTCHPGLICVNAVAAVHLHVHHHPGRIAGEAQLIDLPSRVGYIVTFLHMTVGEIRKLAEVTPEIARELGQMADQFQTEADDLAAHISE